MHLALTSADDRTIGTARTRTGRTSWIGMRARWQSRIATWDVPADGTYTLKAEYPAGTSGPTVQIGLAEPADRSRIALGVALFLGSLMAACWIDGRRFFAEWQAST